MLCVQETRLNSTDAMINPVDLKLELQEIAAEFIGWSTLDNRIFTFVGR